MRSLALLLIFFAVLPLVFTRPHIGIYLWSWLGYMNPHRLTWGVAYNFPFAQLTAVVTLVALLFTRERARIPINGLTVCWFLFIAWMNITTLLALDSSAAAFEWERTMKIQLFAILTIILINDRQKLNLLIVVVALSIGFYGLKGGIFAVASGAQFRVWGPPGSFIEDNNSIGLALIMTLPLLWFILKEADRKWQRMTMAAFLLFSVIAVLATHSRGAMLGLVTVCLLWLRQQQRLWVGVAALLIVAPALIQMLPDKWFDRMSTIATYEQDSSAMGRITAWKFATQLAVQRPIGGGFGAFVEKNYREFSPAISAQVDERDGLYQNAHSIYFSVLGEHGFPGLILFLLIGVLTLRMCGKIQKEALGNGDSWTANLAGCVKISLIGYAVCGAFLNLAYFDLYYHLVAFAVILGRMTDQRPQLAESHAPSHAESVAHEI